jgi:hypothetical protein
MFKNEVEKLLENKRQVFENLGTAVLSVCRVECQKKTCEYDFLEVMAFRKYEDAERYLNIRCDFENVEEAGMYYDSELNIWILKILSHSNKK